ncbi:DUF2087 domain-containing protein [Lactiplantibacillus mudanjiangensis]|uniref:Transcriptional regulator [Lactobacillus pentosus] n=1 Tax=Lactiplantibacillus mudanjiangensis TaxID=1296538 RepID=A0A660E4T2_9LACO|nr:DUF2087 domain-containing protein [Lactiplantibacillus mudanjiangensis]VDG19464.1 transcriptional regulator [Lactobacillus pentosus] [Lactiplantibacillus mudanjiangensis]VDG25152.1 transcriptional regulator [Lactobacillus pentosus] [Lactiplantibacillus mudanjiangensis]VDG27954.1 transcriptional regulator [Lactobacillus pentosus] [Lactiplantibacillus mudanjiangensis]VDG30916.1 transcriptional regulator [Lactobacillus pentosus] [Lactiplantibacillus mudanjiangensis]
MDLAKLSLTDLQRGWQMQANERQCNYCAANWVAETPVSEIEQHLQTVHGGNLNQLIHLNSRYNTLTAKQQDLLTAFATGIKDQDLAKQLQVAAATIRHQKFTFREKAKQAKLYLAIYEQVFGESAQQLVSDPLIDIPEQPRQPDDRWLITESEAAQTLQHYFDFTTDPLRLIRLPKKQKSIIIVLTRIIDEIPVNQPLTEPALNELLKPIYFDYVTVRRYLIEYGFLSRRADGSQYWRPANNRKEN